MSLENVIRKIIGKDSFHLSEEVPITYVMRKGKIYVAGLIRGFVRRFSLKENGKRLFLGKHVKTIVPSKIYLGSNVRLEENVILDALLLS